MIENQNIINELMTKVQESQHEITCMNDSRDFEDAESVRSGPLSHVPSESALLPPQAHSRRVVEPRQKMQPDIWDTHGTSGNVFASSPAYSSTSCTTALNPWDDQIAGRTPMRASTEQLVVGSGDGDKDTIPTPRFLRSSST